LHYSLISFGFTPRLLHTGLPLIDSFIDAVACFDVGSIFEFLEEALTLPMIANDHKMMAWWFCFDGCSCPLSDFDVG
jgi:hypothetical protein